MRSAMMYAYLFLFVLLVRVNAQASTAVDMSTLASSITAIRVVTIPASVQPIQHSVQCGQCYDYTVTSTQSVNKHHIQSASDPTLKTTHQAGSEITLPIRDCRNGDCINKKIWISSPTKQVRINRKPVNDLFLRSSGTQRRKLHQFGMGAAALGLAAYALDVAYTALNDVRNLRTSFEAFQAEMLQNVTQLQAQVNQQYNTILAIQDSLHRLSANVILQVAQSQILALRTAIRLASTNLRLTHIPAYAAAATLFIANYLGYNVPVYYSGYESVIMQKGSNIPALQGSLDNQFFHYLGIADLSPYVLSILNATGYSWNPCGLSAFVIVDVNESLMPWGSVFYSAIAYAVFPLVDFNPITTSRSCPTSGFLTTAGNGGCFAPPNAIQAERIRRTTLFQAGSDFARIVPLSGHDSRDSLLASYTFNNFGYVDIEPSHVEPICSTFPNPLQASSVVLPLPQNVALIPGSSNCYDSVSFQAQYTNNNNNNLCPANANAKFFTSGVLFTPPPIGKTPFPVYQGEIDYINNGTINFKTLAINNQTVHVYLLRANVTFFYHVSIGLARTPDFYDEWVTEDGRSVPDELIQQYTAWGLTTGATNVNSSFAGLTSIPAAVYTLPDINDKRCFSDACAINRKNYQWDSATNSYGQAFFPIVIAPATTPIPCDATYDCSTVGAANVGKTPAPCLPTQGVCCNAQGYNCFVRFSGTDSVGQTINTFTDTTLNGLPVNQYLSQTIPSILPNYDFLQNLDKEVAELKHQMNITFPAYFIPTEFSDPGLDPSGVFKVIGQGIKAAAEIPLEVADKAANLLNKLNPLGGLAGGLDSFLGIIMTLIEIVVIVGIVGCLIAGLYKGYKMMKGDGSSNSYGQVKTSSADVIGF